MHPTVQTICPWPSIPYSTSVPQLNPKLFSIDPIHHGLIPKFCGQRVRSTWMIMALLEISLWPQEIQWPLQFCQISNFKSQIQFSYKFCHWIILQPLHTLENFKFNSPLQSFQFIFWHTLTTITWQFISSSFQLGISVIPQRYFISHHSVISCDHSLFYCGS